MEDFKKVLSRRIALMGGFNGLAVAFIALTTIYGQMAAGTTPDSADFIRGFQVGIFIGLQLIVVVVIAKYRIALKDATKLKALYISENDERTKFIHDKIGGMSSIISIAILAIACIMAGFYNVTVFFSLLGALLVVALVRGGLKLYYRKAI